MALGMIDKESKISVLKHDPLLPNAAKNNFEQISKYDQVEKSAQND